MGLGMIVYESCVNMILLIAFHSYDIHVELVLDMHSKILDYEIITREKVCLISSCRRNKVSQPALKYIPYQMIISQSYTDIKSRKQRTV